MQIRTYNDASVMPGKHNEKPPCKLTGTDGNIFALTSRVARTLQKAGQGDKVSEVMTKVLASKSYDEALQVLMEYVEIR